MGEFNISEVFNQYLQDTYGGWDSFHENYFSYFIPPFEATREKFKHDKSFWREYAKKFNSEEFKNAMKNSVTALIMLYQKFDFSVGTASEFIKVYLKWKTLDEELLMAAVEKAGTYQHQDVLKAVDLQLLQKVLTSLVVRNIAMAVEEVEEDAMEIEEAEAMEVDGSNEGENFDFWELFDDTINYFDDTEDDGGW